MNVKELWIGDNMKCIINDVYDDLNKKDFIVNSIKNINEHDKLSDTFTFWGKDVVINHVAIDEHNISISNDVMWVSEYKNDALLHEVVIKLDKLNMFCFTTEDDIEYCFKF